MKGTVKWFNEEKGFGFIKEEGVGDVFVHYSQIVEDGYKSLKEGDLVDFEMDQTMRGYQARNVIKR